MWYRFAKQVYAQNPPEDFDRETLDQTGGVRTRIDKSDDAKTRPVLPFAPNEIEPDVSSEPEPIPLPEPADDDSTFTDYTPPSTAEETQIEDMQDAARAQDLSAVMSNAGVTWPMHDSCRCRIQFRPDDSSENLLVPIWEVAGGACTKCLRAQQAFNAHVESTGVRVEAP